MELVRPASTALTAAKPLASVHELDTTAHSDDLHSSAGSRRAWRINCGDVINRERCLTVLVERDRVVLVGPPGETAVLDSGQLGQLRAALTEAAEQAER